MHFTACDVIYSQFSENRLKLSLSSGFKDQEIHFFIEISHFVEVLNQKTRMTHIKKIIVLQKKLFSPSGDKGPLLAGTSPC